MVIKFIITFSAIFHLASMQLINEFDNAAKHKLWISDHKENVDMHRINNIESKPDTEKSESSITYVEFDDK
jgi:hypothetical protein